MRSIQRTVAIAGSFVISVLLSLAGTGLIALSSLTLAAVVFGLAGGVAAAIAAGSLSPVTAPSGPSMDGQWR